MLLILLMVAGMARFPAELSASESPGIKDTREAREAKDKEYRIKAAFLFNFAKFVEWPASAFAQSDTPITIGILGEDPFGTSLDETVRGERVRDRKLAVLRSQKAEDLKDCQLVFVSKSESAHLHDILAVLRSSPTLTVSDVDGFCQLGGVMQFYLDANKVRFRINQAIAQGLGLKLSAQLLSVGKPYAPDDPEKQP